jgi:hypothetical protein
MCIYVCVHCYAFASLHCVCLESSSSSSSSSNTYTYIDGGLLFIPHGMLIALRGSGGGADTKLVKYCFTDASNLHTVRHNAAMEVLFDKKREI